MFLLFVQYNRQKIVDKFLSSQMIKRGSETVHTRKKKKFRIFLNKRIYRQNDWISTLTLIKELILFIGMSKLSLKSDLSQILKQICSRNSQLKDLVAHEDVLDKIINLLQGQSESDHHQSLPNFLNQDCGIKYRDIRFLINELSSNSTSLAILSQKITKLWLTMYIFELVDGLKPTQSQKRKKIQDAFKSYQFQAGNLEDLIQVSFKSVEEPFQKDDIANIANDLMAKKPDEIAAMFEKKQKNVVDDQAVIQYARKSVEEQLNDLIADYKIYPEESFEKILQAELICAYAHKFSIKGEINQHLSIISQLGQLKNEYKKFYGSLSSEIEELFKKISNKDNKNIYESDYSFYITMNDHCQFHNFSIKHQNLQNSQNKLQNLNTLNPQTLNPFKSLSFNFPADKFLFQRTLTLMTKPQRDKIIIQIKQSGTPKQVQSLNEFCMKQIIILIDNCTRILNNDVNQNMKSKDIKAAKRQAKATLPKAQEAAQLLLIQSKECLNQATARQMMQQEQQLSRKTIQYPVPQKVCIPQLPIEEIEEISQSPSTSQYQISQSTPLNLLPQSKGIEKVKISRYSFKKKPSNYHQDKENQSYEHNQMNPEQHHHLHHQKPKRIILLKNINRSLEHWKRRRKKWNETDRKRYQLMIDAHASFYPECFRKEGPSLQTPSWKSRREY